MIGILIILLAMGCVGAAAYNMGKHPRETDQHNYNVALVALAVGAACALSGTLMVTTGWNPFSTLGRTIYPQQGGGGGGGMGF